MKTGSREQGGLLHLFHLGYSRNGGFTALTPERSLWMLAYLAVHDRWVGRDELARLLWPDADPEAAKGNLRQLLYRTRQSGWAPALEVERTQLRWREGSDLHLFRRAYRDKQWLEAVETYQGELLTGFEAFGAEEFSAWLEIERRDLNALWREAAQNQVAVFEQAGRFGEAAGLLERILRSDPLAEDVLCEHLRLAASSGRRDRALELYQSFAKQLDDELGLEPRAETQKRFEELRSAETQKPRPAPQTPASEPAPSAHRLPLPQTQFVGRNNEMEWLEDKLNIPGAQVLCLVGPGGIGKTHLALEAARRFPGQAVFVSLVGHDAGQSLAPAVAQAVGLMLSGKTEAEAELAAMLEGRSVLLVLDNVEQVVEEARRLATHLQGLEGVQLLFTSRVRLGLAAEHTLELGGLSFPQRGESTGTADESYAAIRLLLETVGRVNPQGARAPEDQAEAARICQSVAGVPLALVLAGSWARMLSLGEIADELEKNLDFLGGAVRGLPERHQSIRNVFEYSWRLLSEDQRLALAALSVFRGGFERSAALAVSGASNLVLLELLDSSLIRRIQGHTNRFDLHELVRQYAQEKLEADPAGAAARRKHAEWFLSWAEGIQLRKQKGLELVQWMRRIEQELDNLRAVLGWAEREDDPQTIIRLGSALLFFWRSRGYAREGRGWISRTLDRLGSLNRTQLHANALTQIGDLYVHEGDMKAAEATYHKATEVARAADHPEALAQALNGLGIVALYDHDYPLSRQHFSELSTLTRQLGDKTLTAMALNNLGCVLEYEGDYQGALDTHRESLNLKTEIGDAFGQSISLRNMGLMARLLGDYATAHRYLEQSLEISTALEDRQVMLDALNASSALAFQQADYSRARSLYYQSLRLSQTVQYRGLIAYMLEGVAALLGVSGQGKTAARLLGHADALRNAAKIPVSPSELAAYQTQLENIKATTGELGFSLAWREGQAMSLEQALALALEAVDAVSF